MSRSTASACVQSLREYVAIPSVNPAGRNDLPAEIAGEQRYADHLLQQFRALGLDAERVGNPERPSVIGLATVPGAGETIAVFSHLDTVSVDDMQIDPFDPVVEQGLLFGRGACDTKAGMAAAVTALAQCLKSGRLSRNVLLVGEADEEYRSSGALEVLEQLTDRRPDWAIATEPTELRLVTHHKGIARLRLVARGRSGHSSAPTDGSNAIYSLARAITVLERFADDLPRHPVLGPATLSVGVVGGGSAFNIIPGQAWLIMDRRLLPDETELGVVAAIEQRLLENGIKDLEIRSYEALKHALGVDSNSRPVQCCRAALEYHGLRTETGAVAFGTDAGLLAAAGIPSVVFGPGSIRNAHTAREFVEIRQVEQAALVFQSVFES